MPATMRRINLAGYPVQVTEPKTVKDMEGTERVIFVSAIKPYDARTSIRNLLLDRQQGLNLADLLKNEDLSDRIRDWPDDALLLQEEEWQRLLRSANAFRGYGPNDCALGRRIVNAEEVEVAPKEPEKADGKETANATA